MPEPKSLLKQQMWHYSCIVGFISLIFVIGSIFTPLQTIFLGLLLGVSVSYLNLWITYHNASVIGTNVAPSKRPFMGFAGLGFVFRLIFAFIAIWLALQFPENIHIVAVVVGLGLLYGVMMVDMFIKALIRKR
ncbi:ATP synthase subunit I [Shouchella clausii]|uniref:ATP synthase subunit I n=1 Tax=Shouchella clausii TaxID=79880 RepID=UPI001BB359B6|nr:ATP synthase subunit I [Shouchella clausii]